MSFETGKSKFPIGRAQELEANKETLQTVEVKNKVLQVNEDILFPLSLKEGDSTKIGIFLSANRKEAQGIKNFEADNNHGRSLLLGRMIFRDVKGEQLFRDVDLKGGGHVLSEFNPRSGDFLPTIGEVELKANSSASFGILDISDARKDMGIAELFNDLGIRTYRVIAIIGLEEIVFNGEKISIKEAKVKGLIADSVTPVLEVRAFGTQHRLIDVYGTRNSDEKKRLLVKDAKHLVAQELNEDPSSFDDIKYATWLAETIGKNIGLMRKNGFVHKYQAEGHNITLDGCLVDFDSVESVGDKGFTTQFYDDFKDVRESLISLFTCYPFDFDGTVLRKVIERYETSYKEIYPN
ncbi:MAG: hypothetical protein WC646_00005 [Candidatus Paceibacterota bacterium]|jgi:hypothetical protein